MTAHDGTITLMKPNKIQKGRISRKGGRKEGRKVTKEEGRKANAESG